LVFIETLSDVILSGWFLRCAHTLVVNLRIRSKDKANKSMMMMLMTIKYCQKKKTTDNDKKKSESLSFEQTFE